MLLQTIQERRMEAVIFTTIIKAMGIAEAHVSTTVLPNISFKICLPVIILTLQKKKWWIGVLQ